MRVVFSAAYDSEVVEPSSQLQDDPSSPIDVLISEGESSAIFWMEGGDTFYVGADRNEYAIVDPARPVGTHWSSYLISGSLAISDQGTPKPTMFLMAGCS